MFGFLTSGTKDIADPLVSAKSVASGCASCPRSTSSAASST